LEDTPSVSARLPNVVLQILLVTAGVALGLWTLYRLAPIISASVSWEMFGIVWTGCSWP
jgi:hypothetical protein